MAYWEGFEAGRRDMSAAHCPYLQGHDNRLWLAGWQAGRAVASKVWAWSF